MIVYWAWPWDGTGHSVRAAAICRHLRNDVVVIRGTDDPIRNRALDYFNIPYVAIDKILDAQAYAVEMSKKGNLLVMDDRPYATKLTRASDVYIYRLGRPERWPTNIPKIRTEGAGAFWPILLLTDEEILSKEQAREELGWDQNADLKVAIPSLTRPGFVESHRHDVILDAFPALKWMRAADRIIGCAGANLWAEVNYLGIPTEWLIAHGTKDQRVRIQSQFTWTPRKNAAKEIASMLDEMHQMR